MLRRSGFKKPTLEKVIASRNRLRTGRIGAKKVLGASKKKKKPKSPIKGLKTRLWALCKEIIRSKYGNTCYTCGKKDLVGSSWHTGHFIPSSVGGITLRYELKNLRPQCYYCNINLGGNGSEFYRKLAENEGQKYVDNLFTLKGLTAKADEIFYRTKIQDYEIVLEFIRKRERASDLVIDDNGFIL